MARLPDYYYNLNWRGFIADLLPSFLRKLFWIDWIFALIRPIRRVYDEFIAFRLELLDKTSVNGQRAVLEEFLRRKVGPGINVILNYKPVYTLKIPSNTARTGHVVKFGSGGSSPGDYTPKAYYPKYPSRNRANDGPDFTVQVPTAFTTEQKLRIAALTDAYKTYGTTYNIQLV